MSKIDKILRRKWTLEEKEKLISTGISNGVGGENGVKFTHIARNIIKSLVIYFPNIKVELVKKYLDDLDRLANEGHDPDYYEGNTLVERLLADYKFAKGVFILTNWTCLWLRILIFLIILIGLWRKGGKYYNYGERKYIKLII